MDSRALAASLSSLISQLILLLLLLFPSSTLPSIASHPTSPEPTSIFSLIFHMLSSSESATSLSINPTRKRKRTHQPEPESDNLGLSRNPDSFKGCFRMSSSTFEWLSGLLDPLLECRDPVGSPINLSTQIRLGIGLFRLSTGLGYPEISRQFGVSEPVTRFCVKQLCRVLCTNFRFWVGFPNPNDLESVSNGFESITGLSNCCGIIKCTRFSIIRSNCSGNQSKEQTLLAQIVTDSSSRILSIFAGFRGEKGISRVLKSSTLYKDVEKGILLNSSPVYANECSIPQYLIGDRGYPLLPWLMIPYEDPVSGSHEANFNDTYDMLSLRALKAIANLKNWGVLSRPIDDEFKAAVAYIGACSILHNVLLMREDYPEFSDELDDFSVLAQSSQCYNDNLIDEKALVIRNALAERATEFHNSKGSQNQSV